MSGLFGSSSSTSPTTTKPDYTDLQIQTSASTLPIPWVRGRAKLAPNLIDYDNFQTISHVTTTSNSGGGKGGSAPSSSSTTYTYTAALMLALCEGPISQIGVIWKDQSVYFSPADLNLTLYNGNTPQSPWGWLQGYNGSKALSYGGTAYVCSDAYDLGNSASLSNHNFEVYAGLAGSGANGIDADPAQTIYEFLTADQDGIGFPIADLDLGSLFGASGSSSVQAYCTAAGLCFSPCLTSQEPGTTILGRWLQLINTAPVLSGKTLKFVPYADEPLSGNGSAFNPNVTPIYDLDETDFVVDGDEDPIQISRSDPTDAYNVERLEICDRSNAYAATPVESRDQNAIELYGLRIDSGITAHEICDSAVAALSGQLILQRALYVRNTYAFRLSWEYCLLEPMDIVTLTSEAQHLDKEAVRIRKVEEGDSGILTFTAEELPAGVCTATEYPKQSKNAYSVNRSAAADPINHPVIFEPSAALTGTGAQIWVGASGGMHGVVDKNWGGADVWLSVDGGNGYTNIGTIDAAARQGVLTVALPAWTGAGADTTNALMVNLAESGGQLGNATPADADAGRTLCWVDGEILAFATAMLVGSNGYTLTYLDRGLYGTTASAHNAGSLFCRLDDALFKYDLPQEYVGTPIFLKMPSFNVFGGGAQTLDEAVAYSLTPTGNGYKIAPPSNLAVSQVVTTSALGMVVTLDVAWTASPDEWTDDYQMSYSVNGGIPATVTTGGETTAAISAMVDGTYDISVCAIGLGLTSDPVAASQTVSVENIALAAVTGLELNGQGNDTEFTGHSATFTWRMNSAYGSQEALGAEDGANSGWVDAWFRDYEVTIYDTSNNELRTETTIHPTYTYTYGKNIQDGGPRRAFRIDVVWRDNMNRTSAPASLTVSNPPPPPPTAINTSSAFKNVFVWWTNSTALDFAGTEVWMSQETGFTPSDTTKVYDGPDTGVAIPAVPGNTYYVVLASYDSFGEYQLEYSGEFEIVTAKLVGQDLADKIINNDKLTDDLSSTITVAAATADAAQTSVTQLTTQVATTNQATATVLQQLTTQLNGATTTIQEISTTVNGVEGEWTLKIDNNGNVCGIGLLSAPNGTGGVSSEFQVLADQFEIVSQDNGSKVVPFITQGGRVYMDAGAVEIANLIVQNAQIGNAAIDTAEIADLAVGTAKIGDNAVSILGYVVGSGSITLGLTCSGQPLLLTFTPTSLGIGLTSSEGSQVLTGTDNFILSMDSSPWWVSAGSFPSSGGSIVVVPTAAYHTFTITTSIGGLLYAQDLKK